MTPTPEFVAWTLARACLLREETDLADPMQAERQLRVLRSLADAQAMGRCHAGICVDEDEARGFRASDVWDAYGGEAFVASQCGPCSANTLSERSQGGWAGCYGWLVLTPTLIAALGPRYHRLWMQNSPDSTALACQAALFEPIAAQTSDDAVRNYVSALQRALAHGLSMHWRLIPAVYTADGMWLLPTHCPVCGAPQAREQRHCSVCEYVGHCAPAQKRKARGQRPFTPLAKFLGEAGAEAFLESYRARGRGVE